MEIWKAIPFTNGEYLVSDKGRVMTAKTKRILKPSKDARGYMRVCLFKYDRRRRFKVHRLVAITYIDNPNNLREVNHIDGIKDHNEVSNLEWVSPIQNMQHARRMGLRKGHSDWCEKRKKPLIATNIKTGETILFDSILSAKREIGTSHIEEVLEGKRKHAKGYTFELAEGVMPCQS